MTAPAPLALRPDDLSPDGSWYTDAWTEHLLWSARVERVLRDEQTDFQRLRVLETAELGRMLVLDDAVQVAEADEAGYHELLVHPGLCRADAPAAPEKRVLIIGGGDGGSAREALRHPDVAAVDLVDIDPGVTRAARELLPTLWARPDGSGPLDADDRLFVHHTDGVAWVEERDDAYDLIVVDSTDPVGPGAILFSDRFYSALRRRLRPGGAVAVQAGSWFFLPRSLRLAVHGLRRHFAEVRPYQCWTAIYPGGLWNLVLASEGADARIVDPARAARLDGCDHYDVGVHAAAFALPPAAWKVLETPAKP